MPSTSLLALSFLFFFFNDTATTEIYTLSLHDALPISAARGRGHLRRHVVWSVAADARDRHPPGTGRVGRPRAARSGRPRRTPHADCRRHRAGRRGGEDRKSTRLNSSHANISYAVFCLK